MSSQISVALGVEGAREFQEAIKNSNASIKLLGDELKLSAERMKYAGDQEASLREQNSKLEETVLTLKDKLQLQQTALREMVAQYGEADTAVLAMKDQVTRTETAIERATNQIRENETAIENLGKAEEETGKQTSTFGEVLKANLASEAVIEGLKKAVALVKDLALGTAFKADDIVTLSVQTGLDTDTLQELQYIENLADVSLETLTGSLTKLTRNMAAAKDGTGKAAEAFATLGVSVQNVTDGSLRNNQDVFSDVLTALEGIENATERDAVAMDIFGKSAQDLNPLIAAGAEQLSALRKEAHDVGYVMSGETLESLVATSDAYERMDKSVDALKQQIGAQFAPVVAESITVLTEIIGKAGEFGATLEKYSPVIAGAAVAVGALAVALKFSDIVAATTAAIGTMTKAVGSLYGMMLANPIGVVVALLAGLVTALVVAYKTSDEFRAKVDALWQGLRDSFDRINQAGAEMSAKIEGYFNDLRNNALTWGRDLMDNFIGGIRDKISSLVSTVQSVAQTVRDFIGFSEPKRGPLSNFHTYAPDMMDLYARGIRENASKVTAAMQDSLAGPLVQPSAAQTAAGIVNGMQTAVSGAGGGYTFNLILPDGNKFASYYIDSFIQTASANGTPILNPQ